MSQSNYGGEDPFDEESTSAPPLPKKRTSTNSKEDPELLAAVERLKKKEHELNQREQMLDNRSEILMERERLNQNPRIANWPKCRPLVYMNFEEDMPSQETFKLVRRAYWEWCAAVAALIWNIACMAAVLSVEGGQAAGDFVLSVVFFVFLTPIWFGIFRLLYRAARKSKSFFYVLYLFLFGCEIATFIFFALGIPQTGSGGFFYMEEMFNQNVGAGVVVLIGFVFWCLHSVLGVYMWIKARIEYHYCGGLDKARKEAKDAAVDQAKQHPELVAQGTKAVAKGAINSSLS